ncbi:MAG: hypothetical protein J7J42_04680 [Thermoplasmata archaeon]|nr:hypothetical protein [Thermoplasmata archaeon]
MREIKLTKEELLQMKEVYTEIMSYASSGLFYRAGEKIGVILSKGVSKDNYFEEFAKILKDRGWVKEIEFTEEHVKVKGSVEVHPSKIATCDILRGIMRGIYENYYQTIVKVDEIKCESLGDDYCLFKIRRVK